MSGWELAGWLAALCMVIMVIVFLFLGAALIRSAWRYRRYDTETESTQSDEAFVLFEGD